MAWNIFAKEAIAERDRLKNQVNADRKHIAELSTKTIKLNRQNQALRAAAEDFVRKCDNGLAKSRDSYAKFKAALEVK